MPQNMQARLEAYRECTCCTTNDSAGSALLAPQRVLAINKVCKSVLSSFSTAIQANVGYGVIPKDLDAKKL